MPTTKRPIFRAHAFQQYVQSREKDVLPRFISPPIFWLFWVLLALFLALGWLAWNIRTPVYASATGIIVGNGTSEGALAVLFVPANQQNVVHAGESVELHIDATDSLLQRTVTSVDATLLSPEQARRQYHLDGAISLVINQPSVAIVVTLGDRIPASSYAGSIVQAQVQIGEQSLLSFLSVIDQMIGE
jgi:hypothetical protein